MSSLSLRLWNHVQSHPEDHEAWTKLFDCYSPWLMGWAVKRTGNKEDAADIVQEGFLRMWDHRHQLVLRTERTPRPWIATVIANLARDCKRRNGRFLSLTDENEAAAFEDLDKQLEWGEHCERYVEAWEALGARSRLKAATIHSFLFRVRKQLSPEETAARQKLTTQSVTTNLHRVRLHLALEMARSNLMDLQQGQVHLAEEAGQKDLKKNLPVIDEFDRSACQIEPLARRLEECARRHGFAPDA